MLDEYLFGRAERLSPERPVPVVEFERREASPGGAANVARGLAALGCAPLLVAVVGDDAAGAELRDRLAATGASVEGLVEAPGRGTTRKLRIQAGQHGVARVDHEERRPVEGAVAETLVGRIRELGRTAGAAIVSDYAKGTVSTAGVSALAASARGPVVADPKGRDAGRYRGATHLVPNERELDDLLGTPWDDAGAEALRVDLGLEALVLTRSERGVRLYAGGSPEDVPARARQVFDVTGAGDTFAAVLAAFLAAGEPIRTSARLANVAAGIVVRRVGTATAGLEEIRSEIARDRAPDPKRVARDAIGAIAARRRTRGETVVFTNGCFDLLHVGHIRYLEDSRALGDCLIVGLNADASARRLKGPGRPILDQEERAQILGALSCVDHVVIFDEDTPLELIEAIRPDVLTKGADYAESEIVGADRVRGWGGRVERIELVPGRSTTAILERISGGDP